MATAPIVDAIESRSTAQDAATLRFRRLERVRARQRSRRKHRLLLVTPLVVALVGVGVVGFTAVLDTSLERLREARTQVPAGMLTQPMASTTERASAVSPVSATVLDAARSPRHQADAPPPAARPQRIQAAAPPPATRSTPRAAGPDAVAPDQDDGATAPSRGEPRHTEEVDPTLVIDWLLKSRTRGH